MKTFHFWSCLVTVCDTGNTWWYHKGGSSGILTKNCLDQLARSRKWLSGPAAVAAADVLPPDTFADTFTDTADTLHSPLPHFEWVNTRDECVGPWGQWGPRDTEEDWDRSLQPPPCPQWNTRPTAFPPRVLNHVEERQEESQSWICKKFWIAFAARQWLWGPLHCAQPFFCTYPRI